jgi:hypothetical protein
LSQSVVNSPIEVAGTTEQRRKRGRPPKNKTAQVTPERYVEEAKGAPVTVNKRGPHPPHGLGKGSLPGGMMTDQEFEVWNEHHKKDIHRKKKMKKFQEAEVRVQELRKSLEIQDSSIIEIK